MRIIIIMSHEVTNDETLECGAMIIPRSWDRIICLSSHGGGRIV